MDTDGHRSRVYPCSSVVSIVSAPFVKQSDRQGCKLEVRNPKQYQMSEKENPKRYDLEERTYEFARRVRAFIRLLHKTLANIEDAKQLIRASGSVGSNYIEANEALSKKDFVMRVKICRKEAKESRFFLRLV